LFLRLFKKEINKKKIGVMNCDTFTKKKPFCSESFIKKNK